MLNYATTRKGAYTAFNLWFGTSTVGTTDWRTRTLGSSAIIHSNFKNPNPWSYRKVFSDGWEGIRTARDFGVDHFRYEGVLGGAFPPFPDELGFMTNRTDLFNISLDRLYDKLRGSLDLSIDLAEAGKTAKMVNAHARFKRALELYTTVRNPFKAGKTAWRARHAKLRKPTWRSPIQTAGNGWLEWQYGWKPLMQSVYDTHAEILRTARRRMVMRGSVKLPVSLSFTSYGVAPFGWDVRTTVVGARSCKILMTFGAEDALQLARFTSLNPASIGWELLTFSFVYDWFVNVGNYIRGVETAMLYQSSFRSGYVSYLWYFTAVHESFGTNVNNTGGYGFAKGRSQVTDFQRLTLSQMPSPFLPTFTGKLGWQRLLSSAALLAQFLGKRK